MKKLFLEGACGISGDMTVASLLDLGAKTEVIERALSSLRAERLEWSVEKTSVYGIAGLHFHVHLPHSHHHHHQHRNLQDVLAVLERLDMTPNAKALAAKMFQLVAEAEAKAHGKPLEEVHFHEVGALDSIADTAAAAALYDSLGLDGCIVQGLSEGNGTVQCAHGALPVPVPAVCNIAEKTGIPLRRTDVQGEMVTPTGIAIAATLRTQDILPSQYRIRATGVGLGTRDFGRPNFLRAMILEEEASPENIWIVQCNLDDITGEDLSYAMEKLLAAGARDVHFIPCQMKKNRPGHLLQIIADEKTLPQLEKIILRETTTAGLRKWRVERTILERSFIYKEIEGRKIRVKELRLPDGSAKHHAEYDDLRKTALETGETLAELRRKLAIDSEEPFC